MGVYERLLEFKRKYPHTVAWRLKRHANVINKHLNVDEKILYVFAGQANDSWFNFFTTSVYVITDKRLMVAMDRVIYGYFFYSITPDMFNDLKVASGLIWGRVEIDTIKEYITISNLDKRSLKEIETNITEHIMKEKINLLKKNVKS